MVHQPSGGFQGQATDIMIHAQEILNLRKRLNEIYMKHTGQPIEKVEEAMERDTFFTAEAAKEFGLVDKVIERRPEGIKEPYAAMRCQFARAGRKGVARLLREHCRMSFARELPLDKLVEARDRLHVSVRLDFKRTERQRWDVNLRDHLPDATGDPAGPDVAQHDHGQTVFREERD